MRKTSPLPDESFDQWDRDCREQLRDRYLDALSSQQMLTVYREALANDWSLIEVQDRIDGLLRQAASKAV
ncbi:MAG: hypothetical protein ACRECY_16240 [Phyllobacterium sp.]